METTTIEQIIQDAKNAAKNNKWLSCTYQINTDKGIFSLGVKTFGKWAQIIECCGIRDSVYEKKTWKEFSEEFHKSVNSIIRSI